jgi:hypothetical protein
MLAIPGQRTLFDTSIVASLLDGSTEEVECGLNDPEIVEGRPNYVGNS